jgi:hypothetical protein
MQPQRAQQDDRTSVTQDTLRALVRLLARHAAQDFVGASSTGSNQEDPDNARPNRRSA